LGPSKIDWRPILDRRLMTDGDVKRAVPLPIGFSLSPKAKSHPTS
jgi:hypothetical protein